MQNLCQRVEARDNYRYMRLHSWACRNESKPWNDHANPSKPREEGQNGATSILKGKRGQRGL